MLVDILTGDISARNFLRGYGTNILILRRKMVSEGIVMLKNENNALPLDTDKEVAVFGRIQFHYYKSGTGSGGMVNVTKVVNILDGLIDNGIAGMGSP